MHPPTQRPAVVSAYLFILAFLLGSIAAGAFAQPVGFAISTGPEGGGYDEIGKRLQAEWAKTEGSSIALASSSGSTQNLARLADPSSPVALALAQSDALGRFLEADDAFSSDLIVLGDAGRECVLLITARPEGPKSFAELVAKTGAEVSVSDPGSGAAVTFDALVSGATQSGLKPVFVDIMEALLQLKVSGGRASLQAAMIVQDPSTRSAPVEIVLANPLDYRLLEIHEEDVRNVDLPDRRGAYTFERVRVGGNGDENQGLEVDTACTRGLLIGSRAKLDRDLRSRISRLMLMAGPRIFRAVD